jgi:hypothetical protein
MATVRITNELVSDTLVMANRQFKPLIERAEASRPDALKWGSVIYDAIYGKYKDTMAALPKNYLNYEEQIYINVVNGETCALYFELGGSRPAPAASDIRGIETNYRGFDLGTTTDTQAQWEELAEEIRQWRARIKDARQRRTDFVDGVEAVLKNHSTLAPALKEWGPLWDLIPERYRDKHKEVKERVVAQKTAVDSDILGKLTGAITAAKLGGM